ncbi:Crp/Fnr family transcriptional regulator [Limosilactobacillus fermentum]|uniref:Crp/Fnr family transcriptional regulator n=1 Tax=Limosilactobacillus fermentum TaxID=1613 RepID=UPI00032AD1ED|nr:Crp/Fnr family transcriptional regulator [Limosilactobacillus fermentum]AGL89806.1 Transcriptional regulator [Limosilactobacillus fermentum F-6]MCH5384112.1 Crp/Fnr family transcriptional regulator [Limosilactobacillus fermentum]QWQ33544.1 Crp/Fnr family transcriptional regulator [Limosilactobacillus fermentum]UOG12833.1 Crp/Fnr family transcriptional regulator [Limosilactobacillus fermentum]URL83508.1 Crp/Fnr family transcriptional regulator [Limosilactobacillus fermentum]
MPNKDIDDLVRFLKDKQISTITKKYHSYLTFHGLKDANVFILKEGIIKTSVILQDGREFNISYINQPDVISLLHDEALQYDEQPFNVRIESETATFYQVNRVEFWQYVNANSELQNYVKQYYRHRLSETLARIQRLTMNGKMGALANFLHDIAEKFGRDLPDGAGVLIDFNVTNEDIAGFCGIANQTSVSRMMRKLKLEDIIDFGMSNDRKRRIIITNMKRLDDYIAY